MAEVTRIVIEVLTGDGWKRLVFDGREAWTLARLIEAGPIGVTPIERPAPRWSHYIFMLRAAGLDIETIRQRHEGLFPGNHGRYVLHTPVRLVREVTA